MLPAVSRWSNAFVDAFAGAPTSLVSCGQLTPREFVSAGDSLIERSLLWRWRSSTSGPNPALPESKQFLILRNLPLEESGGAQREEDVDAHGNIVVAEGGGGAAPRDPLAVHAAHDARFDVSITYDVDYRVPRLWLTGEDGAGVALPPTRLLDAVRPAMQTTTATIELAHPHMAGSGPLLSLHPCKHAIMMSALFVNGRIDAAGARVAEYMLLFLRGCSGALCLEIDVATK